MIDRRAVVQPHAWHDADILQAAQQALPHIDRTTIRIITNAIAHIVADRTRRILLAQVAEPVRSGSMKPQPCARCGRDHVPRLIVSVVRPRSRTEWVCADLAACLKSRGLP